MRAAAIFMVVRKDFLQILLGTGLRFNRVGLQIGTDEAFLQEEIA